MSDGTTLSIDNGSFVEWKDGKGRVDLIVRTGKVPGVDGDIEATPDSPAARIAIWENGKPTGQKTAAPASALSRIAPLDGSEEKADPAAALVALHAAHVEHIEHEGKTQAAALTGEAIKTAYDRGTGSWPGAEHTTLTAEEWGLGRARHLVDVALGEEKSALNDPDLLDPEHPAYAAAEVEDEERDDEDEVELDAGEVEAMLAAIRSDATIDDDEPDDD